MEKIIDYKVIHHARIEVLEERVNAWIKEGYIPQGGVTVENNGLFYQAMVKYETRSLDQILG